MSFIAVDFVETLLSIEGSPLNDDMFPLSSYSLSILFLTALGIVIVGTQAAQFHFFLKRKIASLPNDYEDLCFLFGSFFLLVKIAIFCSSIFQSTNV